MAFELFDRKSATTFNLEAFSEEFNESLSAGFELYHDAYVLQKGFEGKRIREYQAQRANSRSISALKKLTSQRRSDGEAANRFLIRERMGKGNLALNQGFSHYTHNALLDAYDYLSTLEIRFMYAREQVKRARYRLFRRVPNEIIKSYSHYVENQLNIIKEEYGKLTRAMLERLALASEDASLSHGDVLYRLNSTDLVEDKLTQSNFQDFYQIIKFRGDVEAKQQLARLPLDPIMQQLSVYPQLFEFRTIYNIAKLEMISKYFNRFDVHREQNEQVLLGMHETLDETLDEAQKLIQTEQMRLAKREAFFNTWWRRPFNKKNLNALGNLQDCLQSEAGYLQKHKAVIQKKLEVLKTPPAPKVPEIQEIQHIEPKIKSLEDLLLSSLTSRFNLTNESIEYLRKLKAQMLERGITDVKNLPGLTHADQTFLGLNKKDFLSIFSGKNREVIALTLNMIVLLAREKEEIQKMKDLSQQEIRIQQITSRIYHYLEKYGSAEVQKIIKMESTHVRPH